MDEKEWELMKDYYQGMGVGDDAIIVKALLDLHARLKAIELSLINMVPILDEIEDFDKRLERLEKKGGR